MDRNHALGSHKELLDEVYRKLWLINCEHHRRRKEVNLWV